MFFNECKQRLNSLFKDKYLWTLIGILLGISGIVYYDFIIGNKMFIYSDIGGDTLSAYWPIHYFLFDKIKEGYLPAWNFNLSIGTATLPLLSYIMDPFSLIFFLVDVREIGSVFVYTMILKIVIAGILFYIYTKKMFSDNRIAMIVAILYAFSGYMILWGQHYFFGTFMVYIPLALMGFEKWKAEGKNGLFILSIFLIALLGAYWLFSFSIFLFFYAVFSYLLTYKLDSKKAWIKFVSFAMKSIGLYLLGVGLACVILLPQVVYLFLSPRTLGSIPKDINKPILIHYIAIVLRSLSSITTIKGNFYSSLRFGEWWDYYEGPSIYCGIITMILSWNVLKIKDKRERKIYTVSLMGICSLLIFPIFMYLFNAFSAKNYRWDYIVVVFFLIFLSRSMKEIKLHGIETRTAIGVFIGIILISGLTIIAGYKVYNWSSINLVVFYKEVIIVFIFLTLYTVLIVCYPKFKNKKTYYVIFGAIIVLEVCRQSYIVTNERETISKSYISEGQGYFESSINEAVRYIKEKDQSVYRIDTTFNSGSLNDSLIQDYYGIKGYTSFQSPSYFELVGQFDLPKEKNWVNFNRGLYNRDHLRNILGVKYLIAKENEFVPQEYKEIKRINQLIIYENLNFIPFGYLYDNYITQDEFKELNILQKDIVVYNAFINNQSSIPSNLYTKYQLIDNEDGEPWNKIVGIKDITVLENSKENNIEYEVKGIDPHIVLQKDNGNVEIAMHINAKTSSIGQVFWKYSGGNFAEHASTKFQIDEGNKYYQIKLDVNSDYLEAIRVDIGKKDEVVSLKNIIVSIDNKANDNFYLQKTNNLIVKEQKQDKEIEYVATTEDPQIIYANKLAANMNIQNQNQDAFYHLKLFIDAPNDSSGQLYWKNLNESFNSTNVVNFNIKEGEHKYNIAFNSGSNQLDSIRLDIGDQLGDKIKVSNVSVLQDNYQYIAHEIPNNDEQKGKFFISSFQDDHFVGSVRVDKDMMLFLPIPCDRGWSAKNNGMYTQIYNINHGFIGIPLTKGDNKLEIEYRTPLLSCGMIITGCSFVIIIFIYIKKKWSKNKSKGELYEKD